MILLADITKHDIDKLDRQIKNKTELLQKFKTKRFSFKENCFLLKTKQKEIKGMKKEKKVLSKKLYYLLNGNGIQKTWSGEMK